MPRLIAIAAMSSNRVIGRAGQLPWHYPEDLQFFKRTTLGHPILMGRTTFESIGRPLPGRQNIVLSRTLPEQDRLSVIRNIEDLPRVCPEDSTVFVIGGAQVYEALLPQCAGLYLTWIKANHEGDTFFPEFEPFFDLKEIIDRTEALEFRYYARKTA